jgi:hypothetical protein
MISKIKIGIILASAMVTSAVVFAAVVHSHHQSAAITTVNPHVQPIPVIPKPPAGKPLESEADPNQADASNDPNGDRNGDPNAPAQQPSDSADNQDQNQNETQANANNQPDAGSSDPEPAPVARIQRHPASYAAAAIAQPAARVKVVRVAHHLVAAAAVPAEHAAVSATPVLTPVTFVPTGTPLTLRLSEPLGSKISQVDQSFAGTVDRDVDIQGHTVIPAGARVNGKVVFARPAGRLSGEASLQLEVTSVNVGHREFEIRTSIRIFGPDIQGKNKLGRFLKGIGKRLDGEEHEVHLEEQTAYTFNLASPLQIH